MKTKRKQSGITLMEMTVVIAIVALLAVFGLPAIRAFVNSLESKGPAEAMIDAALSSARAIALKEQHYAGIRFQKAYDPKGPLEAKQYMIFIINDTEIGPGVAGNLGCRAVEGIEPIKLPDSVGVMEVVNGNGEIDDTPAGKVTDKTTFSILFSPSGKLVIHKLWVKNRDDSTTSKDDIFNTFANITNSTEPHGMFLQDENTGDLQRELSWSKFRIYDKTVFEKLNPNSRYDDYLKNLEVIYINPYTGTIIQKQD